MRRTKRRLILALAGLLGCSGGSGGEDGGTGGTGGDDLVTVSVNGACLLDGDCGPGFYCLLGACTPGCEADDECADDLVCSPHGRCVEAETFAEPPRPTPATGALELVASKTEIPSGGGVVTTTVRNTGPYAAMLRLSSDHPAVALDPAPREVPAFGEVEISVEIDTDQLGPETFQIPIGLETEAGSLTWILEVPVRSDGHYRGGVVLGTGPYLGRSTLEVNLSFAPGGVVEGQTFAAGSFLWPQDLVLRGTWSEDGSVQLVIADVVENAPAGIEDGMAGPFARDVGRELVLTGAFDPSGRRIEGTVEERLTGLADETIYVPGTFVLSYDGPLWDPTSPLDASAQLPLHTPAFDWPDDLDAEACAGLGVDYGVAGKLAGQDPSACNACKPTANGFSCTEGDAATCVLALMDAAYNLDAVLPPQQGDIEAPDPAEWEECIADEPVYDVTTERACFDRAAVACAGALARYALGLASNELLGNTDVRAESLADQVAAEAAAGTVLGAEFMVQAAFAYQGAFDANVLEKEIDLVRKAEALAWRPLQVVNSPGFVRALEALEPGVLRDERKGNDVRRAASLASRYAEILTLRMRLEHRAAEGDPQVRQRTVRHLALWTHLMGARWSQAHVYFGIDDTFDELGAFGELVGAFGQLYESLDPEANPFGYMDSYVPMLVTPQDLQAGRSNYDVVREAALDDIQQFETIAQQAQAAEEAFWQNAWTTQQQIAAVEDQYDEQLVSLCGVADNGLDPDLEGCGTKSGEIFELVKRVELAQLFLKEAQVRLSNNHQRVKIEEDRMREIILNFQETQDKIEDVQENIWKIKQGAQAARSAERTQWAQGECSRIKLNALLDVASVAANCAVDSARSKTPWEVGTVAAKCTVDTLVVIGKAGLQCRQVMDQVGLENSLDMINTNEELQLMAANQEIDQILRQSALKEQVINSEATVRNMLLDSAELSIQVEQRAKEAEIAMVQLQNAIERVSALVARKNRMVALLEDNPQNPGTNPRFLQARLELGQKVLFWREVALRRAYLALRALEYEMNRIGSQLRSELLGVRAPEQFQQFVTCLEKVYEDYQLAAGVPQQYVTEISLREDVFGIREPIFDEAENREVSPGEQFRAILRDPNARRADGTIVLPFTVSLFEGALFSDLLCNDRIESVAAKVVGDYVGDGEIELVLVRSGGNQMRRCDIAGLTPAEAVVTYDFDGRTAVVQAGANDFGDADPNGTFAGWPVAGQQWRVELPPGDVAPANADLAIEGISDIVLRITHRGAVAGQSGTEGFEPICGP